MKQNNDEIKQYRQRKLYGRPVGGAGNNGIFRVPFKNRYLQCVVADGGRDGREHVSVSCQFKKGKHWRSRIPSWEEMCFIKALFWRDDEVVMQLHPKKEDYINNHPHVLHLWKPLKYRIPLPNPETVGQAGVELDPGNPAHQLIAAHMFFKANRS
jgi:hypothetical protein